ncbi:MAG: hypothetical protein GF401_02525 [Chitinivibrionales bacterium]|nr:hypothetical protein [Chitinivibrionales bacterium]
MGQPAARIGDSTVHGGAVMAGLPTVLIGGMPAARMGDMHVCPMVTPAPAPVPHVGGPIMKGSTGVLIGGMPAARMGDMAVCTGPPDSIIMGCMTVLIGETMAGGGGGGGAGAGSGMGNAAKGALMSASIAGNTQVSEPENHTLDVSFVDKAGLPVGGLAYTMKWPDGTTSGGVLGGKIKRTGIPEGSYEITLRTITAAQWSKEEADVGDAVKLMVETVGFEKGEKVRFDIYIKDANYTDHLLESIESEINGNKAEVSWKLVVDEKYLKLCGEKKRYSQPFFFFRVTAAELSEMSSMLLYKDTIKVKVVNDEGKPVKNKKYKVHLPSGEVREGTLDSSGNANISGNVSPGQAKVIVSS